MAKYMFRAPGKNEKLVLPNGRRFEFRDHICIVDNEKDAEILRKYYEEVTEDELKLQEEAPEAASVLSQIKKMPLDSLAKLAKEVTKIAKVAEKGASVAKATTEAGKTVAKVVTKK